MTNTRQGTDNGVNTQALLDARDAFEETPNAAEFTWRAVSTWQFGTHSRTVVDSFRGLGAEQSRSAAFTFDSDHPEVFAADDNGATPTEILLVAVAGCLTAGIASIAQYRGIQLNRVVATVEGTIDLRGILGISCDARNGFSGIKVSYDIDADASREDIESLVEQSQKRSAVLDTLVNPTRVDVRLV